MLELTVISYDDLLSEKMNPFVLKQLEEALLHTGMVGIKNVPDFQKKTQQYIHAARNFSALDEKIKQKYAPHRDAGDTEGYELGAEWFKDSQGEWKIDDKKASFYALVPENPRNKWPHEVDLKTPYLQLGELIFQTGKLILHAMGLNEKKGLDLNRLTGHGRMLHYFQENNVSNIGDNWCGAHFDHGLFTGLVPAYYFRDNVEVAEPEESGLYILPTNGNAFEKIHANDQSILLFQVGEFAQLISNDRIRATKHVVKKSQIGVERFTFALFYNPDKNTIVKSTSQLISDERYSSNMTSEGIINYEKWEKASYERYRAMSSSDPGRRM